MIAGGENAPHEPIAQLDGKVAIVTGGSKGIGAAAACALAEAGADIVLTGRSDETGAGTYSEVVERIVANGRRAVGVRCDVRSETDVEALVRLALDEFGRLDVLINNAGIYAPYTPIWEVQSDWWDEVVETNLRGIFLCCRAAIPHMLDAGGSIVNVTSMAASLDFPGGLVDLAYGASKAAVDRLTMGLARELVQFDIAVNALSPVQIRTPGTYAQWGSDFDDAEYADPSAIGPVITFLASQRAAFTGHVIRRDEFVGGSYVRSDPGLAGRRFPKPGIAQTGAAEPHE